MKPPNEIRYRKSSGYRRSSINPWEEDFWNLRTGSDQVRILTKSYERGIIAFDQFDGLMTEAVSKEYDESGNFTTDLQSLSITTKTRVAMRK